jgi:hypothetical protein
VTTLAQVFASTGLDVLVAAAVSAGPPQQPNLFNA